MDSSHRAIHNARVTDRRSWLSRVLGGEAEPATPAAPARPAAEHPQPLGQVERKKRVRVQVGVDLNTRTNFFVGTSLNLSEGGLFVATRAEIAVGTEVDLGFTLPTGTTVQVKGVVRWRRAPDERMPLVTAGLGVQFVGLSEDGIAQVRQFIAQRDPLVYGEE